MCWYLCHYNSSYDPEESLWFDVKIYQGLRCKSSMAKVFWNLSWCKICKSTHLNGKSTWVWKPGEQLFRTPPHPQRERGRLREPEVRDGVKKLYSSNEICMYLNQKSKLLIWMKDEAKILNIGNLIFLDRGCGWLRYVTGAKNQREYVTPGKGKGVH